MAHEYLLDKTKIYYYILDKPIGQYGDNRRYPMKWRFYLFLLLAVSSTAFAQEADKYFPLVQGNTWVFHHKHVVEEGIVIKPTLVEQSIVTEDTVVVKVNGTLEALNKTWQKLEMNGEEWRYYRVEGKYVFRLCKSGGESWYYYELRQFDFTPSDSIATYNMNPGGFNSPRTVETVSLPCGNMTGYWCVLGYGPDALHEGESMFFVKSVGLAKISSYNAWNEVASDSYSLISYDIQAIPVIVDNNEAEPGVFFSPAVPNPFNSSTTISFEINSETQVQLSIYNTLGQRVDNLADRMFTPGVHHLVWDASGFPSGIYFYRIVMNGFSETSKVLLVR